MSAASPEADQARQTRQNASPRSKIFARFFAENAEPINIPSVRGTPPDPKVAHLEETDLASCKETTWNEARNGVPPEEPKRAKEPVRSEPPVVSDIITTSTTSGYYARKTLNSWLSATHYATPKISGQGIIKTTPK